MTLENKSASPVWKRWLPLLLIAAATVAVFGLGLNKYLTFQWVGLNYESLKTTIADQFGLALLAYILGYIVVVALSLPGALIMTLAGGLLFGWKVGAAATVVAATIGAIIVFLAAKTSIGETLAARAGPWLAKLSDGFRENALSYMLFLRLVPAFPFFVVNLAPALLGVSLRSFVLGTFLGIIPGTTAFSVAGAGLGSVVEAQNQVYHDCLKTHAAGDGCVYSIDTSLLVTKELVAAFVLLGIVSLIPVALKKFRG